MNSATKLAQWLKANNRKQVWLADLLDISRNSVSKWCRGLTVPNIDHARAIVTITGGELTIGDLIPVTENPRLARWGKAALSRAS